MAERSCPSTRMRPWSGLVRPAITCSKVLLPDPLAPITAMNSPRVIVSETLFKASMITSPCLNRLVACSATSGVDMEVADSFKLCSFTIICKAATIGRALNSIARQADDLAAGSRPNGVPHRLIDGVAEGSHAAVAKTGIDDSAMTASGRAELGRSACQVGNQTVWCKTAGHYRAGRRAPAQPNSQSVAVPPGYAG